MVESTSETESEVTWSLTYVASPRQPSGAKNGDFFKHHKLNSHLVQILCWCELLNKNTYGIGALRLSLRSNLMYKDKNENW